MLRIPGCNDGLREPNSLPSNRILWQGITYTAERNHYDQRHIGQEHHKVEESAVAQKSPHDPFALGWFVLTISQDGHGLEQRENENHRIVDDRKVCRCLLGCQGRTLM